MKNYLKFSVLFYSLVCVCTSIALSSTTEELSLKDFTYKNLGKYSVDDTTGVLYRTNNNERIYPVYPVDNYTYQEIDSNCMWTDINNPENMKLYDLQFMLARCKDHTYAMPGWEGGNLVIRTIDSNSNDT